MTEFADNSQEKITAERFMVSVGSKVTERDEFGFDESVYGVNDTAQLIPNRQIIFEVLEPIVNDELITETYSLTFSTGEHDIYGISLHRGRDFIEISPESDYIGYSEENAAFILDQIDRFFNSGLIVPLTDDI